MAATGMVLVTGATGNTGPGLVSYVPVPGEAALESMTAKLTEKPR